MAMYIGKHGKPTLKLGDAKTFTSSFRAKWNRLVNTERWFWNITCHSKNTIFIAKLKGK